jgi:hypothetical protein
MEDGKGDVRCVKKKIWMWLISGRVGGCIGRNGSVRWVVSVKM